MASHKSSKNAPAPLKHKNWYVSCPSDKCALTEQRVVVAQIVGGKGPKKRAMCIGCREFLPDSAKPYKR